MCWARPLTDHIYTGLWAFRDTSPGITALGPDRFVIAVNRGDYYDSNGPSNVAFRVYDANGTALTDHIYTGLWAFRDTRPTVMALGPDRFVIAINRGDYWDSRSSKNVVFRVYDTNGTALTDHIYTGLWAFRDTAPGITALGPDRFVIAVNRGDYYDSRGPSNVAFRVYHFGYRPAVSCPSPGASLGWYDVARSANCSASARCRVAYCRCVGSSSPTNGTAWGCLKPPRPGFPELMLPQAIDCVSQYRVCQEEAAFAARQQHGCEPWATSFVMAMFRGMAADQFEESDAFLDCQSAMCELANRTRSRWQWGDNGLTGAPLCPMLVTTAAPTSAPTTTSAPPTRAPPPTLPPVVPCCSDDFDTPPPSQSAASPGPYSTPLISTFLSVIWFFVASV